MYKEDRRKDNGQRRPVMTITKEDRSIKNKKIKITVADNAEHPTGPDNTDEQQELLVAEIIKRRDSTRKCAGYQEEYDMWRKRRHQQKTTGIIIMSRA